MRSADVPQQLAAMACPEFGETTALPARPLAGARVSVVSSAGLFQTGDSPFSLGDASFRIIDALSPATIHMSHVSVSYDRVGFAQDLNVVFPIERLNALAQEGVIGSVARHHYSVMGATDPIAMQASASAVAARMREDSVDIALLLPV